MMEIRCNRQPWRDCIELAVIEKRNGVGVFVADQLIMRQLSDVECVSPTIILRNDEAQGLMDELWRCGLRPSEGTGSAGSLAATEKHLKDMQSIALGLLRKDGIQV